MLALCALVGEVLFAWPCDGSCGSQGTGIAIQEFELLGKTCGPNGHNVFLGLASKFIGGRIVNASGGLHIDPRHVAR